MSLLVIRDLYSGYGEVDILKGLNLTVDVGEIIVIVGPNGAGKSTVLKSLFGLAQVHQGEILWRDRDITHLRTDRLVQAGICYVPQVSNVFPSLTVQENLEMGAFIREDDFRSQLEEVYGLFPDLKQKRSQTAGTLSGGQRQMVAMGRALMVKPKLLLLDEPTAGLSPLYVEQIFAIVEDINRQGISVLMVEQNAKQALSMAHRGYVLAMGANRFEDTGPNILTNPDIAKMFLGG
ncbi:ABC transporter ATP-binding protein [Oscillatoria sp. CS-180]|uniref:ABC transporter ATP-binding protein n=1 Tax=Oscillatoria sp. CS-180 TaxID=3021720 RepID=UPI00232C1A2B|nr:ABC transporter ATP-binding protein [Oscillatoria sp. CS-180]MDB9526901.1 ABC transporter ATP-binding protein [Oscillatoria sp. CS-180]